MQRVKTGTLMRSFGRLPRTYVIARAALGNDILQQREHPPHQAGICRRGLCVDELVDSGRDE